LSDGSSGARFWMKFSAAEALAILFFPPSVDSLSLFLQSFAGGLSRLWYGGDPLLQGTPFLRLLGWPLLSRRLFDLGRAGPVFPFPEIRCLSPPQTFEAVFFFPGERVRPLFDGLLDQHCPPFPR